MPKFLYYEITLKYEQWAHSMYMCVLSSSGTTWNCGTFEHALL